MKRLFDLVGSIIALTILSPVMVCCIILIFLGDFKSPLFRQERVGLNGAIFTIYKFRSMKIEAPNKGPHFTMDNDPRITYIGRILRRTSLDELPQLFNVLLGDMSFVGPRPDVIKQKSEYDIEEWNKRTSVKPGITGLAQATLRSSATHEQRIELDLTYVNKQSLLFDLKILLLTFEQLIRKGGN